MGETTENGERSDERDNIQKRVRERRIETRKYEERTEELELKSTTWSVEDTKLMAFGHLVRIWGKRQVMRDYTDCGN